MAHFAFLCAPHNMTVYILAILTSKMMTQHNMTVYILAIPTSKMMTHLAVPPLFWKSGSAHATMPYLYVLCIIYLKIKSLWEGISAAESMLLDLISL